MADSHSTPDITETGTERKVIVGYRPQGLDTSTPSLHLSGKWMRAAGFDTGRHVTVKVMQGCIVLVAYSEKEQALFEELKTAKQVLNEIQGTLAVRKVQHA
ncbi:SymE family type I addiction module toxin [Trabulsiella odontotermitis]|uniref:SymE family type I addiction module toxin n=1 Tax=Trabulsiella odontotermitis TaxID=379893 RepID=UPI0024B7CD87|nr:SymE family type I addiction module toxin [Trabulsiella odontotermitis]WHP31248.1 SymE family type I addiction module toxin [Trabulsiella odontotermitis]